MKTAIVVTTIFEPRFLGGYLDNVRRFDRAGLVDFFVICDRKTPASVFEACARARAEGMRVECPPLSSQEQFLGRVGAPADWIPWNTDNRRNVGFLMALASGAEVLISIDDDNFCLDGVDFVGSHIAALREPVRASLASSDHWFNVCSRLKTDVREEIYPRGFPYFARRRPRSVSETATPEGHVAINAGLWTVDPDVDAVTRLALAPHVASALPGAVTLGTETWSPINTQNTSLWRDAAFAYYYVRMGVPVGGLLIDRFGDILSGYFAAKCAKSTGDFIRFGPPVAEHRRTPHNLFRDLAQEVAGMVVLEDLLPWLMELRLSGSTYEELYAHLADELEADAPRFKGFLWDAGAGAFLTDTASCMRTWLRVLRTIG